MNALLLSLLLFKFSGEKKLRSNDRRFPWYLVTRKNRKTLIRSIYISKTVLLYRSENIITRLFSVNFTDHIKGLHWVTHTKLSTTTTIAVWFTAHSLKNQCKAKQVKRINHGFGYHYTSIPFKWITAETIQLFASSPTLQNKKKVCKQLKIRLLCVSRTCIIQTRCVKRNTNIITHQAKASSTPRYRKWVFMLLNNG